VFTRYPVQRSTELRAETVLRAVVLVSCVVLLCSCLPWKKKESEADAKKPSESRWVYSEQKSSRFGEQRRAVSYSSRPYAGSEAGESVAATARPILTPYLLGRLKYKLVVLEFLDRTTQGKGRLSVVVTQEVASQLEKSGAAVLVDGEVVKKSVGKLDAEYLTQPSSLRSLRTLLGVHGLVTGSVEDLMLAPGTKEQEAVAVTVIEARLFDTETGMVIRSLRGENPVFASLASGDFSRDKAVRKAVTVALDGVIEGIVRGLSGLEWSTTVASVDGKRIYLNAGKASGLKEGDILAVFNPGKPVVHPVTKVPLGIAPGSLKGTVKVAGFFGVDAAEAEAAGDDTNEKINAGDIARLAK